MHGSVRLSPALPFVGVRVPVDLPHMSRVDLDMALAAYLAFGRSGPSKHGSKLDPATIAKGTSHCGAGCTIGDIVAESLLAALPALALALGWKRLWQDEIFSAWILDFILAFGLGIFFQYFSIKPMHPDLSPVAALKRAVQADALSLIAWQAGMYLAMALAHFLIFPRLLGRELTHGSLSFWWIMQFAMLTGFATSYPVNRWLIASGIKEAM